MIQRTCLFKVTLASGISRSIPLTPAESAELKDTAQEGKNQEFQTILWGHLNRIVIQPQKLQHDALHQPVLIQSQTLQRIPLIPQPKDTNTRG